jgi:cytochrome P450/NADPH-cytochrome P450 reductase
VPTLQVKTVDAGKERATVLRQEDALLGRVVENRVLTKNGPVKRHIGGFISTDHDPDN